jgi:hypothetical protein
MSHWYEAIRVLNYHRDTRKLALTIEGKGPGLKGFVDANYTRDLDHRHSTIGYVM